MKFTPITTCRSCNSKSLKKVISLGKLYLSEFIDSNAKKTDPYPLSLMLCAKCLLLQLQHTTPTSLLYTDNYGYKSGVNDTMRKELKGISRKALQKIRNIKKGIVSVDIGANDGTLLKNYPNQILKIGVEPIKKLAKECIRHANIVINDFFNYSTYKEAVGNKKASIITAISCFYDIANPNQFLTDVTKILDENGVFIIQQNYLKSMLELNAFDNIVHEHLEYYSMHSLNNLIVKHNLEIFDVEISDMNGGSFRTYLSFKNKRQIRKSVHELLKKERKMGLDRKETYRKFAKRIRNSKKLFKKFIEEKVKTNKKIYVYGASTRGNTLLQYYKLNNKLITAAVERNPEKWGKKIASTNIPIISEKQARKEKPDYMLILPWFFKKEFIQREKSYLNSGGHFIFPLPKLEIV